MQTRVFFINYHMHGEELEAQLNELIKTCESTGMEVLDVDLKIVPLKVAEQVQTYYGYRYLVILKCDRKSET
jgi:hypothetical protein